jgi:nucleotide-binding universal stress UspA family protein
VTGRAQYIVGFDGSPSARSAVALTAHIAEFTSADVTAAFVLEEPDAWIPVEVVKQDRHYLHEEVDRLLAEIEPDVDRVRIDASSPSRGLHDFAVASDAQLLAVGTTHHGAIGRLAPGSVGMHLLHGAPCSVLCVPAREEPWRVRSIGIAYSDTVESRTALAEAITLAERLGATLTIMGVATAPIDDLPMGGVIPPSIRADVHDELLQRLERVHVPESIVVDHRAEVGGAAARLTELSSGVDLLVCGSRGYGPLGGVLLGSVSRHLVDHAVCPVLVVPRRPVKVEATSLEAVQAPA